MNCEKILLAGFSGAGKTSFIKELEFTAPEPSWGFQDLDQLIMKSHPAQEIGELIDKHGWEKFRLWERQELESWLKAEGPGVLALGGGALSARVLELYTPTKKVQFCHLHVSFEDCWERLHLEDSEPRPLVKLGKDKLYSIYQERQKIFEQIFWRVDNPKGSDLSGLAQDFWKRVLP